jgi:hypothetical protein
MAIQVFYSRIRDRRAFAANIGEAAGGLAESLNARPASRVPLSAALWPTHSASGFVCSGRASTKKKFRKSRKVFIFNLPRTFAIVSLPIFILEKRS